MKKAILFLGVFLSCFLLNAQSINLELLQSKIDDVLQVDILLSSATPAEFELGSSSFPFTDLSGNLDLSNTSMQVSDEVIYSPNNNNLAYSSLGFSSTDNYVHVLLLAKTSSVGLSGGVVDAQKRLLCRLLIPIKNKCGNAELSWLVNAGTAITDFSGNDLTADVNYLGPQAYKLSDDLVVPYIIHNNDLLYVEVEAKEYIWYLNDEAVQTSDLASLKIEASGTYKVEAKNDCETQTSPQYTLELITSLGESDNLKNSVLAFPNPFVGKTTVQYQVRENSEVVIELYGLLGEKLATLVKGNQSRGVYNLVLDFDEMSYKSGTYVLVLQLGDVRFSHRIVELSK